MDPSISEALEATCGVAVHNLTWISHGPQETYSFGKSLGETLQGGAVIALMGELGAGKTCLTQGIAGGLGVPEGYVITSPTFTLINEYPGRLNLYHMDMYRLSGVEDLDEIGYDACFTEKGVVVIEWAERIRGALPEGTIFILLKHLDENKRKVVLSDSLERIDQMLGAVGGR
ncbi:MAG: tRNA (adenosine(37)-N6)-threonylcarbamoyltransferase complex ATPase subunit type 1 TsaE [Syntrophales bacterium LBB04]|nr:tRNA (adenosine(37)-N6)-threonylcarbamoyltransferase complex ATPase subunit type 1 TsaE [Syntrophales bacterium LBB04]